MQIVPVDPAAYSKEAEMPHYPGAMLAYHVALRVSAAMVSAPLFCIKTHVHATDGSSWRPDWLAVLACCVLSWRARCWHVFHPPDIATAVFKGHNLGIYCRTCWSDRPLRIPGL